MHYNYAQVEKEVGTGGMHGESLYQSVHFWKKIILPNGATTKCI